jgi:hypothetical protein
LSLPERRAPAVLALAAGLAASVGLAVLWHAAGWPLRRPGVGYPFTRYFTDCVGPASVAVLLAVSFALGWLLRRERLSALGMVLPLPIAAAIEIARDPTDHNLWPFEVVMIWLPTFAVLFLAAYAGRRVAAARRRPPVSE